MYEMKKAGISKKRVYMDENYKNIVQFFEKFCTILYFTGDTFLGVLYFLDKVWYNTKKNSGKNAVLLHRRNFSSKISHITHNMAKILPELYKKLLESMV